MEVVPYAESTAVLEKIAKESSGQLAPFQRQAPRLPDRTSVKKSLMEQLMKALLSVSYYEHVEDRSSPARSSGKSMCAQGTCRIDRGVGLA